MKGYMTTHGMSDEVYFLYYHALVDKCRIQVLRKCPSYCLIGVFKTNQNKREYIDGTYTLWTTH